MKGAYKQNIGDVWVSVQVNVQGRSYRLVSGYDAHTPEQSSGVGVRIHMHPFSDERVHLLPSLWPKLPRFFDHDIHLETRLTQRLSVQ